MMRIDVENYTSKSIGSNSIDSKFQSAIVNFSKAQALDEAIAWASTLASSGTGNIGAGTATGQNLSLEGLKVADNMSTQEADAFKALSQMSKDAPSQFRKMANNALINLGRGVDFARSLS